MLIQDSMKESTWPMTIHYQISSFQVKPLATKRHSDKTSCLMLSNPLASCSLPKREVWQCFKASLLTNLFPMLIYNAACVRVEPRERQSLLFSGLFEKFCTCDPCVSKRETVLMSQKYCEQKSAKFGENVAFFMRFGPFFYDEHKVR